MRLLVLGGTAFLGYAVATEALRRGHAVTCLARGPAPVPAGATFVAADRDDPGALASVAGTRWDAVVDVSLQPGQVRHAVAELDTAHWVFVSSCNVYERLDVVDQTEDAPVRPALAGDVMTSPEVYGEAKVACEEAVRAAAAPATVVRAGLIGGPGDDTARSGYWPWRFAHPSGPDVVVPDDPEQPIALIDVRDLAAWIVTAAQERLDGVYNATGPTVGLAQALRAAAEAAGSTVPMRPLPPDVLIRTGVQEWMGPRSLPLWIADPTLRGFGTLDTRRARAAGLSPRPLEETFAAALAWERGRVGPRPSGLTDAEEEALRAAADRRR